MKTSLEESERHERPIWENQLWHARNLLARNGLSALENPHAATGKICRCGSCFCCAALEVANEAREGQAKIYWRDLQRDIPIRLVNAQYITAGHSLVYWMGSDGVLATETLDNHIRDLAAEGKAVQS